MAGTDIELMSTEELIRIDLGCDIVDIFNMVINMDLAPDNAVTQDIAYYRGKSVEARQFATKIRKEISRVLRAKTIAQNRLTSRQARFEISMDVLL